MPRGMVEVDGVLMSAVSKQYKDLVAEGKVEKKTPPPPEKKTEEVASFELPSFDLDDKPKDKLPNFQKAADVKPKTKRQAQAEDEVDFTELLLIAFAGLAALTNFEGWKVSEEEASSVARPLARILSRHKNIEKIVRDVADPVALIGATAAIVIPRAIQYSQVARLKTVRLAAPIPPSPQRQPDLQPPSRPPGNPQDPPPVNLKSNLADLINGTAAY